MTTVQLVENVLLKKFQTEPFHNFYLIYNLQPKTLKYGGTCSDKTLSLLYTLKEMGIPARLHSSIINDQEIHRLVSVIINGKVYFADVGNGWPSIKLFPKDHEIVYSNYGITYRSTIQNKSVYVYQERRGKEKLSTIIPFSSKSEKEIMKDIENRFNGSIVYPFSDKLRFSLVVGDKFLFLRDKTLYFYCEKQNIKEIVGIERKDVQQKIKEHFCFDTSVFFDSNNLRDV